MATTLELLDAAIKDLEAKLNLAPGESLPKQSDSKGNKQDKKKKQQQKPKKEKKPANKSNKGKVANTDQPEICKLEFKVGVITKVWLHPDADKLYCEEIDVGEPEGPRQIASGLRPHFTEEQMLGQRLLVVSNLKAKNLVGFKSHGMVLCASDAEDTKVEFVEPPVDAPVGEVITFEGLPPPEPFSGAQVEKKKVWVTAAPGMKTSDECVATWDGHAFMTSAGPCKTKTIANGQLR